MKKYLFSTMALSALMVGCSQEELAPKVDNVETEKEFVSVKGHDLLGPLTIKVGEETRVDANGWQNTDKIGLAWFDIEGDIKLKQTVEKFKNENFADNNIYGNHLFTTQGNNPFTTQTNVYQGAHFVYFPFERATQVDEKTVTLNKDFGVSQNDLDDYKYDRLNNVFHISTSDFISGDDVDDDMKLTKQFTLSPVANTIKINTTPKEGFETNETLKDLTLTSYVITAKQEVFETEFNVVTKNVPIAQYKKNEDGTFMLDDNDKKILDVTANIEALDEYAAGIEGKKTSTLTRKMAKGANYKVGTAHELPLHVLPISGYTSAKENLSITINVVTSTGLTGHFTIDNPKGLTEGDLTDNMKAINKLDEAMAGKGNLTKILRDNQKAWAQVGLNIDLAKANFTLDAKIKDYDQWADAVAIYEALGQDADLEVIGDVQFTNKIDTLTSGKITVTTDGEDAKMNIVGNVTLPSNTALDLTKNAPKVVVGDKAELIIKDGVKLDNKNVTNNGIITLGKLSQIGDTGKGITNNNRINVVYGSYAYLAEGKEGKVAYEIPSNYKYWELENLISLDEKENTGGLASVNTFVVGYDGNQQVTLDLNGMTTSEGSDDPYKPEGDTEQSMPSIANITIEMEGGILTKGKGSESPVKEILVVKSNVEGDNQIIGVKVLNNITVNNGAKAAMEGGSVSGNITNNGTFNMKDVRIAKEEKDESGAVTEKATVITNNGEMTVDATKTVVAGVEKATFTASADKLVNTKNNKFTVGAGIATITIAEIINEDSAKITASNTNQVKFSKMTNNGILEKVTQIVQ